MRRLVEILDEKKITVINAMNPYGSMNRTELRKFYEKYGFVRINDDGLLVREPRVR